VTTVVRPLSRT